MKLHFDNVNLNSTSGPNTFATRLVKGLLCAGIEVVDAGPDADVSIVFIEPSGRPLAKKVVQRLDGIWFKPEEFELKNKRIKALYQSANAVVWQSAFDRMMTTHWWGSPKHGVVIHNGIERPQPTKLGALEEIRRTHDLVFVASSNWHPQKRLRANIELFNHLASPRSCLIVMGSNPDCWVSSPKVMYTGPLAHEECSSVFSIADWMLHLAWLDHCPNVVVEALAHKVPVICSSSGGTRELVQDFGLIVAETAEYNFELANYDEPPSIDTTKVVLPNVLELGPHADVSIENAIVNYVALLKTL
jgi:glycosyltransferase involved in cell wall biosynthesis